MPPSSDDDVVTPGDVDPDEGLDIDVEEDVWPFLSDRFLNEWAPGVLQAQNAWMASIDSLREPDRKTHELIRLVVTVGIRNPEGVRRHARLAREVGASWEEILGSIMLTVPGHGLLPAVAAIPHARRGYEEALEAEQE